jgi:hypothetical protein
MNLVPKRKIFSKGVTDTIETTTITNELVNEVDRRSLGYFNSRLRIPVGTDKYD